MASIISKGRGVYQVRIFLGKVCGKSKHHNKTIHGTLKDAKAYEADYRKKLERGLNPFTKIKTLSELFVYYKRKQFCILAPNTQYLKDRVFSHYILPALGNVSLMSFNKEAASEFVLFLIKKGYSNNTVRNILREVRCLFNYAIESGICLNNPFSKIKQPAKKNKKEIVPLNEEEIKKLLTYSENHPENKIALFIRLALVTGARPSEYLALKWEDISFEGSFLKIKRTVYYKKGEGCLVRNDTKTEGSRRKITLDPVTLALLQNLKSREATENDKFILEKNGTPIHVYNFSKYFKTILKEIGINRNFSLYWLRHTCATFLLNKGLPVKDVAARLGHKNAFMTLNIYSQALSVNEEKAANMFL